MTTQSPAVNGAVHATNSNDAKTILVTGGAGFIGSNFVHHLRLKYPSYRIIVLDMLTYAGNLEYISDFFGSDNFQFAYGDIRNRELVDRLVSQSDIVVHFAAESHVSRSIADTSATVSTDVVGTDVVAGCVVRHKDRIKRFIHISTSEVYGTAHVPLMDEEHPLNPCSPYAGAKAGADRLVSSYYLTYGIPAVIVRPFNNYGPRQHLEKLIPRLITSCILEEPLPIHGDGSAARDWLFVRDHCEALDLLLHAPDDLVVGEVFNIGTGNSHSILELATLIAQKMNCSERMISRLPDRPGQVELHRADARKIERILGFKPKTSISDGLDETIAWYVQHRGTWNRQVWLRHIEIEVAGGKIVH